MTTEWLPVHVATMLAAPVAGAVRYQISVCAVPLVTDVLDARVSATPPNVTVTPVGAPCPNASPTTRTRFEAPPGLKDAIVAVVVLAALVFPAAWTETEADARPAMLRTSKAAGNATRNAADPEAATRKFARRCPEHSRRRTESMETARCNAGAGRSYSVDVAATCLFRATYRQRWRALES